MKKTEISHSKLKTAEDQVANLPHFKQIEAVIEKTDGFLQKVKSIEKDVIKHSMTVEDEIEDNIFKGQKSTDDISNKLIHVLKKIDSLNEIISSVTFPVDYKGESSSVNQQVESSLEDQPRVACDKWLKLITEKDLLENEDIKFFLDGFDKLHTTSQLCLLSLSIFPLNSVIKKRPLSYWLIAEDFIKTRKEKEVANEVAADSNNLSADEVGDGIFEELINQGFIKAKKSTVMNCFTVHPLAHRCLISLARKANLFSFKETSGNPSNNKRAIFLTTDQDFKQETSDCSVTTVFNINKKYLSFHADDLWKLKKVVVLQLGRWQNSPEHHIEIENEESLRGLKAMQYLRYLSLQGISRIFTLPNAVTQLISLEILDLRACHDLEKLPSDISSLRNLTHLDISECHLLESMPKGIEKLSNLQVLKGFVVGNTNKPSCSISDLVVLKKLRKLGVYIRTKAVVGENDYEKINEMGSLHTLTILWGESTGLLMKSSKPPSNQITGLRKIFSKLPSSQSTGSSRKPFKLPSSLRKLDLRCIPTNKLPECIDLSAVKFLEKLYIRGGKLTSLEYDGFITESIKILRLKYLKNLEIKEEDINNKFVNKVYFEAIPCNGCSKPDTGTTIEKVDLKAIFPSEAYEAQRCEGCNDVGVIWNKDSQKEITISWNTPEVEKELKEISEKERNGRNHSANTSNDS